MMQYLHIMVIVAICIELNMSLVSCIKCYQCRTDEVHDCGKKLNSVYLKDCPHLPGYSGSTWCRKIDQILYFTPKKDAAVIRECAYIHYKSESCYVAPWSTTNYQNTCDCSVGGCNRAASSLHTPHSLSIRFLLLVCLILHRIFCTICV